MNTALFGTSLIFTLQATMITAPETSIIIWITRVIDKTVGCPLAFGKCGRSPSKAPRTTTSAIAVKKMPTAQYACLGNTLS